MPVRSSFTAGEVLTAADLTDTFASKLNLAGGKILQIVRATDSTNRSTTSTSYVDASISVTITPQKNNSAVLLLWIGSVEIITLGQYLEMRITDSGNNVISGAQQMTMRSGINNQLFSVTMIAYATPATTSATTYKVQYRSPSTGTVTLQNGLATGQLYAIEVSA